MLNRIRDFWYMLSIKNKQFVFFGIIILFVSMMGFYSQQTAYSFMNKYYNYLSKYYKINKLFYEISESRLLLERFTRETDMEDLSAYQECERIIETISLQVYEDTETLYTYLQAKAVINSLPTYFEECNKAIEMRLNENEFYYISFNSAIHINDYLKVYTQQLLDITLKDGNWIFNNRIVPEADNFQVITFISIIGIALLCIVFALMFSAYLSKPIQKLAAASLRMSKGDLNVKQVVVNSKDEVGILAESFTKMNISIKQMVDNLTEKSNIERKLYNEEMENIKMHQLLKDAEFLALQSQINPHFLFNTLNTIARTAMFENAENTTKLIQALSALFRYNLGKSKNSTTLEKELQITREYIYIQQYRFGDRIKLDIKCDVDADKVLIPCFTLQPLIENSIIHGLEPRELGGKLRVKISEKEQMVIIKIIDNGAGISKEKISRLMNLMNYENEMDSGHTTGIGIANVMSRLNNFYNGRSKFNISSKPGIGTVIAIMVPYGGEVE